MLMIEGDNEGRILVGYSPTGKLILPTAIIEKPSTVSASPENTIFSIQRLSTKSSVVSLFSSQEKQEYFVRCSMEGITEIQHLDIDEIIEQKEKFEITHLRMIIRHFRLKEGNGFYPEEGRLSGTVQYTHKGRTLSF